jgi:hypothetical protein
MPIEAIIEIHPGSTIAEKQVSSRARVVVRGCNQKLLLAGHESWEVVTASDATEGRE